MSISCCNNSYLNLRYDYTIYPYVTDGGGKINYGEISLTTDDRNGNYTIFSVKNGNYTFVQKLREKKVQQIYLSVNLDFNYNGYTWNLKATSLSNWANTNYGYPILSLMGIDIFCLLTRNNTIVYN